MVVGGVGGTREIWLGEYLGENHVSFTLSFYLTLMTGDKVIKPMTSYKILASTERNDLFCVL